MLAVFTITRRKYMKKCSKCGIEKELSEFGKHNKTKDRFRTWCKCCCKEYNIQYRTENVESIKESVEKYKSKRNIRNKLRYNSDPLFKLENNIRARFNQVYKNQCVKKTNKTFDLVDLEAVYNKLGEIPKGYHIDHIIPISVFDLTNEEHLKWVYHPSNVRILPAKENLAKSDKLDWNLINCSLVLQKIAKIIGISEQ